jgi:hypothetical protein
MRTRRAYPSATAWLRQSVVHPYSTTPQELCTAFLSEIAQTRAVRLRLIDRPHGEQRADKILALANGCGTVLTPAMKPLTAASPGDLF